MKDEFCELVIVDNYDHTKPIGKVILKKDSIPNDPDWTLALGYRIIGIAEGGNSAFYEPICFTILLDKNYYEYMKQRYEPAS